MGCKLVGFLIREDELYKTILPDRLEQIVKKLRQSSSKPSHNDIHSFFKYLWLEEWKPTKANPLPDPTQRFIYLSF